MSHEIDTSANLFQDPVLPTLKEIKLQALNDELYTQIRNLNNSIKNLQNEKIGESLRADSLLEQITILKENFEKSKPNLKDYEDKIADLNHACMLKDSAYQVLDKQMDTLKANLSEYQNIIYKTERSKQAIFLNKPRYYQTEFKLGLGFENPNNLLKATTEVRPLYDEEYLRLGMTIKFVRSSESYFDELDTTRTCTSIFLDSDKLNATYPPLEPTKRHLDRSPLDIEPPKTQLEDVPVQQEYVPSPVCLKTYVPSSILEKQIVTLKQQLEAKQKVIDHLRLQSATSPCACIHESKNDSANVSCANVSAQTDSHFSENDNLNIKIDKPNECQRTIKSLMCENETMGKALNKSNNKSVSFKESVVTQPKPERPTFNTKNQSNDKSKTKPMFKPVASPTYHHVPSPKHKSFTPTSFHKNNKLHAKSSTFIKPQTTPPKPQTTHSQYKYTKKPFQDPKKPQHYRCQVFKDQSTGIVRFRDQYGWFSISKPQKTTSSTQKPDTQSRSKAHVNKKSFHNSSTNFHQFSSTGHKCLNKGLQWVSSAVLNAKYVKRTDNAYSFKKSCVIDDCNSFVPNGKNHVPHA